jgi:PIN like domain
MKIIFPGYSKKNEKEIKSIWDSCVIVFDTNTLLNLYRYSDATRETILELISKLSERIWLPHQAALEYNKNRYEVIADQEKAYKEFIDKIIQIQKDLQSTSKPPFLSFSLHGDLDKAFEKVNAEVVENINRYKNYLKEDPIYDTLSNLFEGKIGQPFSSDDLKEIYKQGEERYKAKIPPGYEDEKNKDGIRMYGDLVLWKQVIAKSKADKKPIVLVTDERKTDWWWKIKDGRNMGPRQELVEEMMKEAGTEFHMYSSERFLSYGKHYLDEKVNKEALEELQAMKIAELEVIKKRQLISDRETELEIIGSEKRMLIQMQLTELKEQILNIELQQRTLDFDTDDNPEAFEYVHSLSIQKAELQDEMIDLRQQLEKLSLHEEILRFREKDYDVFLRKLRNREK